MQKIKSFLFENRTTRQTVVKNTFWLFSGEIIGRLLRTLLIIYAARILGTEGWGIFSYTLSLVAIFMTFADVGLSNLVTREASRDDLEKDKYLSTAFYSKLFLLISSFLIVIVFAPLVSTIATAKQLIPIVALLTFFDSLRDFLLALNRATQKMEREGFIKIITNALIVGFGFYFLIFAPSPKNFALAYFLGSAIGTIWFIFIIFPLFKKLWFGFAKEKIKIIWESAWPIAITGLFGGIMLNVDTVMLGWWRGASDIGLYAAAQRLIQLLYMIPWLLTLTLFPLFSRYASTDRSKFTALMQKSITVIFWVGLPMILGGIALNKEIISIIFGANYIGAALTFAILLVTVLVVFPNNILTIAAYALDAQKIFILPVFLGLSLNVILNLFLIPRYGIEGAAATTIFSQLIIVGLNWFKFKKINSFSVWPLLPKIILASLAMVAATILLRSFGLNTWLNIIISGGFYFIVLYLLKDQTFKEIREIILLK